MDYRDYDFNRRTMEEMLGRIKRRFYGFDTPLSAYVCEKKDVLSDEKIESLADQLIAMIRRCDMRYKYYGIDGVTVRFLKLYLYLMVRSYSRTEKTFGDLVIGLRDVVKGPDSLEELILQETGWQPEPEEDEGGYRRYPMIPKGIFADLNTSCQMLSGHSMGEELTREELQQIWNRHEEWKRSRDQDGSCGEELRKKYADQALGSVFPGDADYNFDIEVSYGLEPHEYQANMPIEADVGLEEYPGQEDDFPSDFQLLAEEKEAAEREKAQREAKWKKSVADPEKFLTAYEEFRSLFFHVERDHIAEALEEAVACFLCREGESGLADESTFRQMYLQLNKIYRRAGDF